MLFTYYHNWLTARFHNLHRLSLWIDKTFFPIPKGYDDRYNKLVAAQDHAESDANAIYAAIKTCTRFAHTKAVAEMIESYGKIHGNTIQVQCHMESMLVELKNKTQEIENRL